MEVQNLMFAKMENVETDRSVRKESLEDGFESFLEDGKINNTDDISKNSNEEMEKNHSGEAGEIALSESKPNENDGQKDSEDNLLIDNIDAESGVDPIFPGEQVAGAQSGGNEVVEVVDDVETEDVTHLPGKVSVNGGVDPIFLGEQVPGVQSSGNEMADAVGDGETEVMSHVPEEVTINGDGGSELTEENIAGVQSAKNEMNQSGEDVAVKVSDSANEETTLSDVGGKKGDNISFEKHQEQDTHYNNTDLKEESGKEAASEWKTEKPVTSDGLVSNNDNLETEIDLDIDLSHQGGNRDGKSETSAHTLQGDHQGAKNSSNDVSMRGSSSNMETKNSYVKTGDTGLARGDNYVSKLVLNPEKGEIKIELNQSSLGRVKVELSIENSQLKAIFHTDSPESKGVIEGGMQDFKESLDKQSLELTGFDVQTGSDGKESENHEEVNSKKYANTRAGFVEDMAGEDSSLEVEDASYLLTNNLSVFV